MEIEPPSVDAGAAEWAKYGQQIHACIEAGRKENILGFSEAKSEAKTARDEIGHGLKISRRISMATLAAALAIIVTLTTLIFRGAHWTYTVDTRLADLQAKGIYRDGRLDSIDTKISDLHDLAVANHETLVGADKAARGRR